MNNSSNEHRSAFDNPYLSASGRDEGANGFDYEDGFDGADGEIDWDSASGKEFKKLIKSKSSLEGMKDLTPEESEKLTAKQRKKFAALKKMADLKTKPLADLKKIDQKIHEKVSKGADDPMGVFSAVDTLKYSKDKNAKKKAAGNLALNILFPFSGIFRKMAAKRKAKKAAKKKKGSNSADGYSIMLNDNGDCI